MKEGKDETQSSDTALQKAVAISRNFMAGTFAGVMECIVGHPLVSAQHSHTHTHLLPSHACTHNQLKL